MGEVLFEASRPSCHLPKRLVSFPMFGGEAEIHPVSFCSNLCRFLIYVSVDAGDHGWFVWCRCPCICMEGRPLDLNLALIRGVAGIFRLDSGEVDLLRLSSISTSLGAALIATFLVRNLLVWKVDSHWFCELLGRPSGSSYRCTRYYSGGNAEWIWGCEFSLSEYALVPSTGHTATGRRRRATLVEDHETHSCSKAARPQPKTRRDSCQTRGAHLHCWTGGTVCSKPELFHIGNWRNWFVWHFTIRNPEATGHRNPGSRGLSRELFLELDELIQARLCELKARTRLGKVMNVLGRCCSAICVYKILMSSVNVNLLLRRGSAQADDPATRLLTILLLNLRVPVDVSYWAPMLSLIFVGYLTLANTRQFIQRLLAIFRMVSTSVTSNSLALLLSEVMAMYFAACVILTLRFVPKRDRADLMALVGEVDLSSVHLHFDYVFLLSSLCSLAVFGLSYWLKGPATDTPHADWKRIQILLLPRWTLII